MLYIMTVITSTILSGLIVMFGVSTVAQFRIDDAEVLLSLTLVFIAFILLMVGTVVSIVMALFGIYVTTFIKFLIWLMVSFGLTIHLLVKYIEYLSKR